MKRHTQFLLAMVLTVGLMLTGFDATAATSDPNSSLSITAHGLSSFSHVTEVGFIDFNNHMVDFSASGKNSSFGQVSTDTSFDNLLSFYRTHPIPISEEPHHAFMEFRGGNLYEWHWEERPVSAVPEPAEYILMACGMGLIGIAAIRRRADRGFAAV